MEGRREGGRNGGWRKEKEEVGDEELDVEDGGGKEENRGEREKNGEERNWKTKS